MLLPGTLTVVALGSDHFIADDPQIDAKTLALMKLVVHAVEHRCAAR